MKLLPSIKKMIRSTTIGKKLIHFRDEITICKPKKSYSQIGEDLIVDHFLGHKKNGFYVDIGAYHPVHLSNTHLFYARGWNGLQVEPDFKRSLLFKKYRPRSTTLNVGVGNTESEKNFYVFKEEALSTFSKESADVSVAEGHTLIVVRKVPMVTLEDIFAEHTKDIVIDMLSVDTEGYDLEVLKTNNWEKYRPVYIIVETAAYSSASNGKKMNDSYDVFMSTIEYTKVADTHLNTIYKDNKA